MGGIGFCFLLSVGSRGFRVVLATAVLLERGGDGCPCWLYDCWLYDCWLPWSCVAVLPFSIRMARVTPASVRENLQSNVLDMRSQGRMSYNSHVMVTEQAAAGD